eukprot:scaffold271043_cov23-Tisochrysis_lutea.AAC.1
MPVWTPANTEGTPGATNATNRTQTTRGSVSGGAGGDGSYGPWGLSGVSGEVEATTWVVVALQFAVCASPPPPGLEAMDAAREEGAPFSIASVTAASCL